MLLPEYVIFFPEQACRLAHACETSRRRSGKPWARRQLGRLLGWLGDRLTSWGQHLQLQQQPVEVQNN